MHTCERAACRSVQRARVCVCAVRRATISAAAASAAACKSARICTLAACRAWTCAHGDVHIIYHDVIICPHGYCRCCVGLDDTQHRYENGFECYE